MGDLTTRVVESLGAVEAAAWDALDHGPSPFTEHGFLRALELSGSVGAEAGWRPAYILVERQGAVSADADAGAGADPSAPTALVGAVAAYIKTHSYGEYIFDWSWARGSQRAGIPYYPKLVIAAPMTPATGRRLLIAPGQDRGPVVTALLAAVRRVADDHGCQSIHWLFCSAAEQRELARGGFAPRASLQYHWRDHGYTCFDDFLGALTSRKRKQVRKERARAQAAVDAVEFVAGGDLTAPEIAALDGFYRQTTADHGGFDYLRPGFFEHLVRLMPHRVQVARVRKGVGGASRMIAGALFLETPEALYGRYWGTEAAIDCLHFETTCYAGIERCIARQIPLFEAGAQGQHKLLRGFMPAPTYSAHWLRDPRLRQAIAGFLREETVAVAATIDELALAAPYRAELRERWRLGDAAEG